MKNTIYGYLAFISLLFVSCATEIDDKTDIGVAPTASFEVTQGDTPNDFVLTNTTQGAFITQWTSEAFGTKEGEIANVNMPYQGEYTVTMTTFNQGGHDVTSKTVVVTQTDPDACSANMALLTGCGEKTWVLAPEANALHIGANLESTWWGNSEADVTTRACHFNDRYTFTVDGVFTYDSQGDLWVDVDGDGNPTPAALDLTEGCHNADAWSSPYDVWTGGTHTFNISDESLTVSGLGAWMGLYKVGTTAEVIEPQTSVTYSILELTETRMVIYCDYGWGAWRFTFVPE